MGQDRPHRKRVVIVDDSRTMQAVLEHLLTNRLGYEVVGIAGDGGSALSMIAGLNPDLVTIDLAMPYIDGAQLLKAMDSYPGVCKVVISSNACDNLAMKATLESMGADGCLSKKDMSRDTERFCAALDGMLRSPRRGKGKAPARTAVAQDRAPGYPVPVDERERIAALARLFLANDNQDWRLDLLTEHLVNTTSFSASAMTFIDEDTQWVKAGCGLDRGSIPRSEAICNYAICGDETLIVYDTRKDDRFATLGPVVTGPMIRSYVGHPIVSSADIRLGAICLLDTQPRRVTPAELKNLRSMARIAAELIENRGLPLRRTG